MTVDRDDTSTHFGCIDAILLNSDGSPRRIAGTKLSDWGKALRDMNPDSLFLCRHCRLLFDTPKSEKKTGCVTLPSAVDVLFLSLVLADNHYGPFDRLDRFLVDSEGNKILALTAPEDITVALKETIFRKYNRPDGCVLQTRGDPSVEVTVCDESGDASDGRWVVHPWLLDLASSSLSDYANAACALTSTGASILEADGLPYGDNACINGAIVP